MFDSIFVVIPPKMGLQLVPSYQFQRFALSPDAKLLAILNEEEQIYIYDLTTGRPYITDAQKNADSNSSLCSNIALPLLPYKNHQTYQNEIYHFAFHPDGDKLLLNSVAISLSTGETLNNADDISNPWPYETKFNTIPTVNYLFSSNGEQVVFNSHGVLHHFPYDKKVSEKYTADYPILYHAVSPNGRYVIASYNTQVYKTMSVAVFDLEQAKQIQTFSIVHKIISGTSIVIDVICFHPNSSMVALSYQEGFVLYNIETSEIVRHYKSLYRPQACFSPDGEFYVYFHKDLIKVVKVSTHEVIYQNTIPTRPLMFEYLSFTNDSRKIIYKSDACQISVEDITTGYVEHTIVANTPNGYIRSLSADGVWVVALYADGMVCRINTNTGQVDCLHNKFEFDVIAVSFNTDGHTFVLDDNKNVYQIDWVEKSNTIVHNFVDFSDSIFSDRLKSSFGYDYYLLLYPIHRSFIFYFDGQNDEHYVGVCSNFQQYFELDVQAGKLTFLCMQTDLTLKRIDLRPLLEFDLNNIGAYEKLKEYERNFAAIIIGVAFDWATNRVAIFFENPEKIENGSDLPYCIESVEGVHRVISVNEVANASHPFWWQTGDVLIGQYYDRNTPICTTVVNQKIVVAKGSAIEIFNEATNRLMATTRLLTDGDYLTQITDGSFEGTDGAINKAVVFYDQFGEVNPDRRAKLIAEYHRPDRVAEGLKAKHFYK